MDFLPIFLNVRARRCLVVGGGEVALRKATMLVTAGARVRCVAPSVSSELRELLREPHEIIAREFIPSDIDNCVLVIAATDDRALNANISQLTQAINVPVNVVDDPELCSYITPALVDRSPLIIAISSGGKAPVLARQWREKLEQLIPFSVSNTITLAGQLRQTVKARLQNASNIRFFWERFFNGSAARLAEAGNTLAAEEAALKLLDETSHKSLGEVFLVGGGPGDPDLLTLKALRLMQEADVVLYDRLVSDAVMNLVRRDATRIYVGKKRSEHAVPQDNINQMLVDLAKEGKRVLRLKGGDPFIFGRGGEEIELLAQNNIPFQVVPGITAASGCAAYAGIPLTHRDYAQSVRFVTGHLKSDDTNLNWPELAQPNQTLVFYMGLVGLSEIAAKLQAHGRSPSTPVALIEKGTTPEQRVFVSDLANIAKRVNDEEVRAPTLIIVGDVVKLHSSLHWYGDRDHKNINYGA